MTADTRALDALRRIEQALARLEQAAERPAASSASSEPHVASGDEARLQEAHDLLRRRVISAIGRLDDLIAAGEPD